MHGLVRGAIQTVNPDIPCILRASTGFTTVDYKQVPQYAADQSVRAQVQALSTGDIKHLDSLNIQGSQRAAYLFGAVLAIVQVQGLGGSLLIFPTGTIPEGDTWLVTAVLEPWNNSWTKVSLTLQLDR